MCCCCPHHGITSQWDDWRTCNTWWRCLSSTDRSRTWRFASNGWWHTWCYYICNWAWSKFQTSTICFKFPPYAIQFESVCMKFYRMMVIDWWRQNSYCLSVGICSVFFCWSSQHCFLSLVRTMIVHSIHNQELYINVIYATKFSFPSKVNVFQCNSFFLFIIVEIKSWSKFHSSTM